MGKLSNELLREKTMKQFLTAMEMDLSKVEISSIEGLFSFSFKDSKLIDRFSEQLNEIVNEDGKNQTYKSINLASIIDQELNDAGCVDMANIQTHKASCKGILEIIKTLGTNFNFSQESGLLEVSLPSPAYAPLLNLLTYPHMTFTPNGKLVIDIKKYLKDIPEDVVKIEGLNANQLPLVFLNAGALESKKMFYATKTVHDGSIEVTPYFFVPQATKPPTYHFVLDVSGSMETSLGKLKKSVNELAKQLFMFQPTACVSITTFSNGTQFVGQYHANSLVRLVSDVDNISVKGDTPLYQVTADFLEKVRSSADHNNILLFTDGQEGGSVPGSEKRVAQLTTDLGVGTAITLIRNKFYIFSYGATQSDLMVKVAKTFNSDVIDTASADFLEAQKDPELMKRWAAARELFQSRVIVEDKNGVQSDTTYSIALDMSGQLAQLKTRRCQAGETLNISVIDGDGKPVIQSTKTIDSPKAKVSMANIINTFGINASNLPQTRPQPNSSEASTFVIQQ